MTTLLRKNVLVVDYGSCNLFSLLNILKKCDVNVVVSTAPVNNMDQYGVILPGVGSYYSCMQKIKQLGWDEALFAVAEVGRFPILGICLGMQLLSSYGEEGGGCSGLGLIPGNVTKLNAQCNHVGWNSIHLQKKNVLVNDTLNEEDFYFIHGYAFRPEDQDSVCADTTFGSNFPSVIAKNNVYGVQFHPEKSGKPGIEVLKNFIKLL